MSKHTVGVEAISPEQVDNLLQPYLTRPLPVAMLNHHVHFASMGYFGMKRHVMYTTDWYAHNQLWVSHVNAIGDLMDSNNGIGPVGGELVSSLMCCCQEVWLQTQNGAQKDGRPEQT